MTASYLEKAAIRWEEFDTHKSQCSICQNFMTYCQKGTELYQAYMRALDDLKNILYEEALNEEDYWR